MSKYSWSNLSNQTLIETIFYQSSESYVITDIDLVVWKSNDAFKALSIEVINQRLPEKLSEEIRPQLSQISEKLKSIKALAGHYELTITGIFEEAILKAYLIAFRQSAITTSLPNSFISPLVLSNVEDLVNLGIWNWEIASNKVTWSNTLYKIYGLTPQMFKSSFEGYMERVHPEDRERVQQTIQRILQTKESTTFEERIIRPNGEVRVLRSWAGVKLSKEKELIGLFGFCADITEQQLIQEELKQSQAKFKGIFSNSSVGIYLENKDGKIEFCNEALHKMLQSQNQCDNTKIINFTHPLDLQKELQILNTLNAGAERSYRLEKRMVATDGSIIWTDTSVNTIYDENGNIQYYVGVVVDISEQKKAETTLLKSELFYKELFNRAGVGIGILNEKSLFLQVNESLCNFLGYSEAEMIGKSPLAFTHTDDKNVSHEILQKDPLIVQPLTKRYLHKDGSTLWGVIYPSTLFLKDDERARMAVILNITERVQAEAKLKKYIESNLQLENFAYVTSHDMKEPLRTIANFSELLAKGYSDKLDERGLQFLEFITDAVKNINQLIDDVLLYSTVNSAELKVKNIKPNNLIDGILYQLNQLTKENNAVIKVGEMPSLIRGDRTQLKQLFQNLIANALKFHEPTKQPKIEISCLDKDRFWEFSVKDNGIGIEAAYFEKIFKLFNKLHQKSEFEGTGIGLALCKKVVENHGGEIMVASTVGEGTIFAFTILK